MNQNKRIWSSTSVSPSVIVTTTTLQNFGLHTILEPPLRVSLDDCTHSGSLHEPMWVFASALLAHFIEVFACWYQSHACNHVMVMLKVFASYVDFVFITKESLALTHGVTLTVAQVLSWLINDQSQVSHLSLTPSVSHVEHVGLDGLGHLVVKSCWCVFARAHVHLSLIHTLSYFLEVSTTGLPYDS